MDEYGTQKSIALLKFLFERGGLYGRGKDLKWKNIKDMGMYMWYHAFYYLYQSILCSEFCVYLIWHMASSFILCNKLREPIPQHCLTSSFLVFFSDILGLRILMLINLAFQSFQFTTVMSDTLNSRATNIWTQCQSYILVSLQHGSLIPFSFTL